MADLARQFDVSSSTIRRLLKQQLSDQDYESLVATKNSGKTSPKRSRRSTASSSPPAPKLKVKSAKTSEAAANGVATTSTENLEELIAEIEHDLDEAIDAIDEEMDDDLDLEDEDEDLLDEEDADEGVTARKPEALVQISPLSEAVIPKPCYLVVDRTAELITRPLQDFSDLGNIPEVESSSKTLPVFENHRVARRFSQRSQRVIKVPSGALLTKTGSHLSAKGITRLLINGQVYAL